MMKLSIKKVTDTAPRYASEYLKLMKPKGRVKSFVICNYVQKQRFLNAANYHGYKVKAERLSATAFKVTREA